MYDWIGIGKVILGFIVLMFIGTYIGADFEDDSLGCNPIFVLILVALAIACFI